MTTSYEAERVQARGDTGRARGALPVRAGDLGRASWSRRSGSNPHRISQAADRGRTETTDINACPPRFRFLTTRTISWCRVRRPLAPNAAGGLPVHAEFAGDRLLAQATCCQGLDGACWSRIRASSRDSAGVAAAAAVQVGGTLPECADAAVRVIRLYTNKEAHIWYSRTERT